MILLPGSHGHWTPSRADIVVGASVFWKKRKSARNTNQEAVSRGDFRPEGNHNLGTQAWHIRCVLRSIAAHKARGGQSWYYIYLDPRGKYLNRFTDYPTLKVRLLPWVNYRYGMTGYLHWGGNFWTYRPFDNLRPDW